MSRQRWLPLGRAVLALLLLSAAAVSGEAEQELLQTQAATAAAAAAAIDHPAVQAAIATGIAAVQAMNAQAASTAAAPAVDPSQPAAATTATANTAADAVTQAATAVTGAAVANINTVAQDTVAAAAPAASTASTTATNTAATSTTASTVANAAATAATTTAATTASTTPAAAAAGVAEQSAAETTTQAQTTTQTQAIQAQAAASQVAPQVTQSQSQGVTQSQSQSITQSQSQGVTQSQSQGVTQSQSQGVAQSQSQGVTQSQSQGVQVQAAEAPQQGGQAQVSETQPQGAQAQGTQADKQADKVQVTQADKQADKVQGTQADKQADKFQVTQAQTEQATQAQKPADQVQVAQAQPQSTQTRTQTGGDAQAKATQVQSADDAQARQQQPVEEQEQQAPKKQEQQKDTDGPSKEEKKAKKAKKAPVASQTVVFAPSATVANDDDVDDDGECETEVEKLCKDVEQGEGKLAECLSSAIAESESGAEDAPTVSPECREEVFQFKISRNSNINANVPLAKACKEDAEMFCNVTWFFGYHAGQVLGCLKEVKAQISKRCKTEVYKIMMDAAVDFRSDPVLYEACKEDSESLCLGVDHGGGRIQACLRDKRMQLSWACEEQLFKQEMENADDIRLSVRLFAKCMPDKRKFCKDIEPGNARAKECLEENREKLSSGCKDEVDAMIERRVHDFRLDPKLRDACEEDIFNMCAYYNNLEDIDVYDSTVINCLQDFSTEIKSDMCKEQVKKYVSLAAQDIRFDVPLAEACYEDRQKYCARVPPGSARVMRCLSNRRDTLSPVCRATLFDEEVRFSENIDFQAPMKAACEAEIDTFCKRVPHENGRVIRCLQDNKGDKAFGKPCLEEVQRYEMEISRDYRLNYRLRTACQKDIQSLCPSMCSETPSQVCGGKVLRCLSDKSEEIKADACRKEVEYFEKMEVSDFRNDIILAEACRQDVDKYCAKVEPGEGRVHKCLRDNVVKISKPCRTEELLLEQKEAGSIELSPNLLRACKAERAMFCKNVAAGSARVFRCLAEHMRTEDFGAACRSQVGYKLQRRQSNWRLDPPLRKACRTDVTKLCAVEDLEGTQDGAVYKCMIRQFGDLASGCQRELGRAMHMAFFAYQPGAVLTGECDADVKRMCLKHKPNMAKQPGMVGTCLAHILEAEAPDRLLTAMGGSARRLLVDAASGSTTTTSTAKAASTPAGGAKSVALPTADKLSAQCFLLVDIAEPPDARRSFEASLTYAGLLEVLGEFGSQAGLGLVQRDRRGTASALSLTGWAAMAGVAAFVLLLIAGMAAAYRRLRGGPPGYTLVLKAEPK